MKQKTRDRLGRKQSVYYSAGNERLPCDVDKVSLETYLTYLGLCKQYGSGALEGSSYIAAHDRRLWRTGTAKACKGKLRVIIRMLPFISWQRCRAGPPCLASIVTIARNKPQRKIPYVLPNNVAGQRQNASDGEFESTMGSKTRGHGRFRLLPSSTLPMSKRRAHPSGRPYVLHTHPHPPTHPSTTTSGRHMQLGHPRSPISSAAGGKREQSAESESRERGGRKGWTQHHASVMLTPYPKGPRPGTLQS